MSGFTPGPWYVATCSEGEACWCRLIVTRPTPDLERGDYSLETCVIAAGAVNVNDASLIAAAPELYETLRWLDEIGDFDPSVRERVRAALAKVQQP